MIEETSPAANDVFAVVINPSGPAANRKITVANTATAVVTQSKASGGVLNTGSSETNTVTPKSIEDSILYKFPEGHIQNGKIVTTESSGDLTVSIKGTDGNDPSATNPVKVRISDTVRTITAALSVTLSGGTNCFGSGGGKFAAKERDYFTYLGYNSTDGVVIGVAVIPWAIKYGDFSTTNTNEKYCAISTITNATSTDGYINIGRFNATFSSGYEWSIPATSIIINKPIFESRQLEYTNTYGTEDQMTFERFTTDTSKYKIVNSTCELSVSVRGFCGYEENEYLTSLLPFTASESNNYACSVADVVSTSGRCELDATSTAKIYKFNNSRFTLGHNRGFTLFITYNI